MPPAKREAEQAKEATAAPARVTRAAAKRSAAASSEAQRVGEDKKVTKKAKGTNQKKAKEAEVEAVSLQSDNKSEEEDTIIVEHCKQCTAFKKRATLVKEGLEKAGCGITVILNPEKPRRGCFEIRQGGRKFISLLNMKRPFKPMKDLDMDKVISDIIDEIS